LIKFEKMNNKDAYSGIEWVKRDCIIKNKEGEYVCNLKNLEFPEFWDKISVDIVASKYFATKSSKTRQETSLKQLIDRIVDKITEWGIKDRYFDEENSKIFSNDLKTLMVNQQAIFNTPVMINIGTEVSDRASACFIIDVEDSLESIYSAIKTEANVFKDGSGSGVNISKLRGKHEKLSGGGFSSGPMEFLKIFDTSAGAIKSAGRGRRSARMVCMDIDHPDIEDFISCKVKEEEKAKALIDAGFDGSFDGEVYKSIQYQNANHSIRVSDHFMKTAISDGLFSLTNRDNKEVHKSIKAKYLLTKACEAAYKCGDPGIIFSDTSNAWFTCKNDGEIECTNPCGEFLHLPYTACNLATLNLMSFMEGKSFNLSTFKKSIKLLITAQDILVDNSSYPDYRIKNNSIDYRPLGLGFTNLGALLMSLGYPYDSPEGREIASALTSLLTSTSYKQSSCIASELAPFKYYDNNREPMIDVLSSHISKMYHLKDNLSVSGIYRFNFPVREILEDSIRTLENVKHKPLRNSAVTLFAPNGTTGLAMGCDTTGIEPCISLVSYKSLVGGGTLKIVNNSVVKTLHGLGYNPDEVDSLISYIKENDTIEGSIIKQKHLPVFDCALKPFKGTRSISWEGHVNMMASLQPFISMSISKTVNLPSETTVEDIFNIYIESWKKGLKSITIYRDGSKTSQPLNVKKEKKVEKTPEVWNGKKSMPPERSSITHKFNIAGHEGYLTVGMYDDGSPGELFVRMSKEGSVISGLMDSFAKALSLSLQYGVPVNELVDKFKGTNFDPAGITTNKDIPVAKSIIDYVFSWIDIKFGSKKCIPCEKKVKMIPINTTTDTGIPCSLCGGKTVKSGSCSVCVTCGTTTGCS
jgi:ribonucleoside-diphosphate reductase alpha chain